MTLAKKKEAHANSGIIKLIFFGNYFYGLCAVALSIEANLQQRYPLNHPWYYLFSFAATIVYYTYAYMAVRSASANKRLQWYFDNKRIIQKSQLCLTLVVVCLVAFFIKKNFEQLLHMPAYQWFLILVFPLVAGLYYGISYKPIGRINLRNSGWLKPFVIGFTWAGATTVYPVIVVAIESKTNYQVNLIGIFLTLKNFMFVSVLCIMFDIKDYADDYNQNLKTFVTRFGLRKTIFDILLPLSAVGLGCFLVYGAMHQFSIMKILLNTIPFIALLSVAYSVSNRRSIFYYLIIIDGLMLVKAICGTTAMLFF